MNISRFRRDSISRSSVIIPILTSTILSFIISSSVVVSASNDEIDFITCDDGNHSYSVEEEVKFAYFNVDIKLNYGSPCPDYSDNFNYNTSILIFDINNTRLYYSGSEGSKEVKIHSRYIRIYIVHASWRYPWKNRKYEVTVNIKHFKVRKPVLNSFIGCTSIFSLIFLSTLVFIKGKPKEKTKKRLVKTPTSTVEETKVKKKNNLSRHIKLLKSNLAIVKFDQLPDEAICMISKTTFEKDNEIVQCTNCLSCYLKNYILDWLENNDNCPVCQAKLE